MTRTPPSWMDGFMTAGHWTWRNRYNIALAVSVLLAGFLIVMAVMSK